VAKFNAPKRIRIEDFDEEFQELVGTLGFDINDFLERLFVVLNNGQLGFDNINRRVETVRVELDGSGDLVSQQKIRGKLNGKVLGLEVIKADNVDDPDNTFPTSAPWISWTYNNDIITITKITGLQASSKYDLVLELIGS